MKNLTHKMAQFFSGEDFADIDGIDGIEKYNESLAMAIKALEQEPCEDWYDLPADEMTFKQARQCGQYL